MLSSEEQRQLAQIEADIRREDPDLAARLSGDLHGNTRRPHQGWYRILILIVGVTVWTGVAVAVALGQQLWIIAACVAVPVTAWLLSRSAR